MGIIIIIIMALLLVVRVLLLYFLCCRVFRNLRGQSYSLSPTPRDPMRKRATAPPVQSEFHMYDYRKMNAGEEGEDAKVETEMS